MAYKPKPELEEGSYIAYTNEPDTVMDAGSGGGGGEGEAYNIEIIFSTAPGGSSETINPGDFDGAVKINGVEVTGFKLIEPTITPAAGVTVSVKPFDSIFIDEDILSSHQYEITSSSFPDGYIPAFSLEEPLPYRFYAGASPSDTESKEVSVIIKKIQS